MNDTPTPRTKEIWGAMLYTYPFLINCVTETGEMEAELTAAREELADWRILNGWGGTPEIINDFIKGQQTRIHHAQNIEEELTTVTEQRDGLRAGIDYASDQLAKVTEQRDRLAAYRDEFEEVAEIAIDILAGNHPVIDWRDAGQSELLRKLCQHLEENASLSALDEARGQRDRLAEALRKAISWGDSASHHILHRQDINWTYLNEAREALQSLNEPTSL